MKGIYIAAVDLFNPNENGVIKKIYGQVKAFKNLGIDMDIAHIEKMKLKFNNELLNKRINKPSNFNFHSQLLSNYCNELKKYNFVYIRFSRGDIKYYKLIKFLNENNVKVIIEIPTYPYKEQYSYKKIKNVIYGLLDVIIWKKIKKYVYRIATTNSMKSIEGVKCINISNGIDLDELPLSKYNQGSSSINMVGIANLNKWHGYDRVIIGLYDYYKTNDLKKEYVKFYVIGEGREKQNLLDLTEKLGLNNVVKFLGLKSGNELDHEIDKMNIGISSLALFRAGGGHDPIKTKEFLGRGLPVVLGYEERLVDMKLDYVIKVKEDESKIDINYIVKLYEDKKWDKKVIRKYSSENLSWESQIKKVVDSL